MLSTPLYSSRANDLRRASFALLSKLQPKTFSLQEGYKAADYRAKMGMNFIINERNKESGADTLLLDRYVALLFAIGMFDSCMGQCHRQCAFWLAACLYNVHVHDRTSVDTNWPSPNQFLCAHLYLTSRRSQNRLKRTSLLHWK